METLPSLAISSLRSVATVACCSSVGVYARRQGILDDASEKFLDKMVSSVCLPCLILWQVPPLVTLHDRLEIWPLTLPCLCTVTFGLVAGATAACLLNLRSYSGLMMTAAAFPNSFSVPMTLLLTIASHPLLTQSQASGEGTSVDAKDRISMLFLASYPFWVIARWGIGFPVLSGALSMKEWWNKVLNPPVKACLLSLPVAWALQHADALQSWGINFDFFEPVVTAVGYAGRCSVPLLLIALGAKVDSICGELWAARGGRETSKPVNYHTLLITSCGQPTADRESATAGAGPDTEKNDLNATKLSESDTNGSNDPVTPSHMPLRGHIAVLVLRQLFGALLGLLLAFLLRRFCGITDHVLLMTLLLQSCGPPMINLSVMAGVSGTSQRDSAKLLLITYSASVFTWIFWTTIYLFWL